MRKLIFIISILFWLLCLFGVYMSIGMRGDGPLIYAVISSLLFMAFIPTPIVIVAFRFIRHRKILAENLTEKKLQGRQKIYLIVFIIFLFIFASALTSGLESSTRLLAGIDRIIVLSMCIVWFLLRKRPRVFLIIFLSFLFLLSSLVNLGNSLPAKFYLLGISIELVICIIFLPPLLYLIKPRKEIKSER